MLHYLDFIENYYLFVLSQGTKKKGHRGKKEATASQEEK